MHIFLIIILVNKLSNNLWLFQWKQVFDNLSQSTGGRDFCVPVLIVRTHQSDFRDDKFSNSRWDFVCQKRQTKTAPNSERFSSRLPSTQHAIADVSRLADLYLPLQIGLATWPVSTYANQFGSSWRATSAVTHAEIIRACVALGWWMTRAYRKALKGTHVSLKRRLPER